MHRINRIVSTLLAAVFILHLLPVHCFAGTESRSVTLISFGSYPQSKVTDENLIAQLEELPLHWISYHYYSGTDLYDDGQMTQSDYMRYADINYNGNRYRAVLFDTFRPAFTGYESTAEAENYQDDNGYVCNTVYWFKYEPLLWRIIDRETGYVICESVVDAQPFSNGLFFNGSAYYMDNNGWDYSNYYVNSSIRNWLNTNFADTAFTDDEKEQITINKMDDFWKDIEDRVFLPSANEMKNTDWWKDDTARIASGTDYAASQGLFIENDRAYWRLRNAADWSEYVCAVSTDGSMYGYDYYYRVYPYQTSFTGTGVRPAIKLGNLNEKSFATIKADTVIPETAAEIRMNFIEKLSAFIKGIKSIVKYYVSPAENADDNVISVMDSLGRGINVPCMEDGWAREWVLEKEIYTNIKNKGFDYIRLPANLVCMCNGNGILNESAANNLDRVLQYAMDAQLSVILDLHGWQDLNTAPSAENIETLVSVWEQIAVRYKDRFPSLLFEIYNEPNNDSGKMSNTRWNYIQNKATAAIREADSDRIIVLSSLNYNVSSTLSDLCYNHRDPYIVLDVHNYSPMEFTHQGAEWLDGCKDKVAYTEETKNSFADAIETAAEFHDRYGTKIIVGEFGAYLKQTDKADITAFLTDAVAVMEENSLPWAYWEYYAGFGAYDCTTKTWRDFVTDGLFSGKENK